MLKTSSFFKGLSDQTRLRCLLLLTRERELCVCELVEALDLSQPLVSRHLAHLRGLGIVEDERRGQWVYYRLHPDLPKWAMHVLEIVYAPEKESEAMTKALGRLEGLLPSRASKCG